MYIIKNYKNDINFKMFTDVHHMMKFFKDQIYIDLKHAIDNDNFDCIAVLSKIFDMKLSFKEVASGKKSINSVAKEMFAITSDINSYGCGRRYLKWNLKDQLDNLTCVPNNYKILIKMVASKKGDYLIPSRIRWNDFYKEFFSKNSTVLSEEEKIFTI